MSQRNAELVKRISNYEQIYKTIPYNDKILTLSDYELFIDFRLSTYIKRVDNIFRMVLPIIFLPILDIYYLMKRNC